MADLGVFDPTHALLHSLQPLREFSINSHHFGPTAPEIIRRHASTLERLCVVSRSSGIMRDILLDDHGLPISYPQLQRLAIRDNHLAFSFTESLPPGYMSFPALEYAHCSVECPEFIELLLQNNSRLLRCFHLNASIPTIQQLTRKGVFDRQFLAMEHVEFRNYNAEDAHDTVSAALRVGRTASEIFAYTYADVSFSDVAADIARLKPNARHMHFPELITTVEQALGLVKAQPLMNELCLSFTLADAQSEVFREHTHCARGCICDMGDEAHGDSGTIDSGDITKVISSHMDVICAESDYLENLFARYYPVSERLVILDAAIDDNTRELSPLVEICASLIYLTLLCPSIRTLDCTYVNGTYTLHRSDLQKYALFRAMEERLLALASDDK